jgi:hypothetical protein
MKMLKNTMKEIQNWWQNCDFKTMEEITGFKQSQFNPEDGYQEFVDACDNWWNEKPISEKMKIYKEYQN